jgi:hypothetical protein
VARGIGGQFVLFSACLKMLAILLRVFQFLFNIIWKKEMSPEAPIQLAKDFPILLTLNLPTTTIVAQPFNVIKWQLKFNPVA